jgi:hypothetical protein
MSENTTYAKKANEATDQALHAAIRHIGDGTTAQNNGTYPATPTVTAAPTGYRVSVVPGALEVSARLVNPEEARNLMKALRAGIAALEDTTEGDMDEPLRLTKRVPVDTARVK